MSIKIKLDIGDCYEVMQGYDDDSIDDLVTDPPYGLGDEPDPVDLLRSWVHEGKYDAKCGGFMGRKWDATVPGPAIWREALRVLKPGAEGAVFAGTRT